MKNIFLSSLIKHPRATGAIWPSSRYLVEEIIKHVPIDKTQDVLELGAGTGVITRALLEIKGHFNELLVNEFNPDFVRLLQNKFPQLNIIEGNAGDILKLFKHSNKNIHTIISSLPLRSLPKEKSDHILEQIYAMLPRGGRYIQFTYSYSDQHQLGPFKNCIYSKRIWRNLPPARVDLFIK
jgi:phosphatidylethanolamine/phosphatidyl-N-methylethanolamine N-methyltransferase